MPLRKNTVLLLTLDLLLVSAAWWLAFWLRLNLEVPAPFVELAAKSLPWVLVCFGLGLVVAKVYRQVWRYVGMHELRQLAFGVALGGLLTAAVVSMLRLESFPRSVFFLQPLLVLVMLGAVRAAWRSMRERTAPPRDAKPLLIVGSLQDASDALRALKGSPQWVPVGIVSPLTEERGRSLQGVAVLGNVQSLATVAQSTRASTVLVASPAGSAERRAVLMSTSGLTLLTMPPPGEWLQKHDYAPRKVQLDDLLGREPVQLDTPGLSELLSGQTVLVTGAGGSIGSELCRQIARFGAARMVCVDASEFAVYQLEQELRASYPQMQGLYYTANVRESDRLHAIAEAHRPVVVFHAAAYKHVPLMENLNEIEALRTNVLGTLHAARAAAACGAQRFVLVSTDKAVNPTNIMGASKRLAELVVQAVARDCKETRYVSVRFGNVLGSSGSVVPLFTDQINRGGPVTITHPDIVRYFMTIPEAAQLVLQAGWMGATGQIFVLDMGEPVKIVELARMMIRLSGKTEQDIPLVYTGLRPGEKLFEELLANDETTDLTPHAKLRVAKTHGAQDLDADTVAAWVNAAGAAPCSASLRQWLQKQVPEYLPRPAR